VCEINSLSLSLVIGTTHRVKWGFLAPKGKEDLGVEPMLNTQLQIAASVESATYSDYTCDRERLTDGQIDRIAMAKTH